MSETLLDTPSGPARVTRTTPTTDAVGRLVLGHGAGGLRWTDDVVAVREAATAAGWVVDLVDQPWRVAEKRIGPGPAHLDTAWLAAVRAVPAVPGPLVLGGRSAGARVACRTAEALGAAGVLALSFPLHPPGRPERSRADELRAPAAAGLPVLVVQGRTDPFGTPAEVGRAARGAPVPVTVAEVAGTHTLERAAPAVAEAAAALLTVLGGR